MAGPWASTAYHSEPEVRAPRAARLFRSHSFVYLFVNGGEDGPQARFGVCCSVPAHEGFACATRASKVNSSPLILELGLLCVAMRDIFNLSEIPVFALCCPVLIVASLLR